MAAQERKRRFWRAQIRAWERSGLTQAAFCRRRGLSRSLFGYWKQQLAVAVRGSDSQRLAKAVSVELVPVAPRVVERALGVAGCGEPGQPAALSVLVGARYRVEVRDDFEPSTLARVVRTLEAL